MKKLAALFLSIALLCTLALPATAQPPLGQAGRIPTVEEVIAEAASHGEVPYSFLYGQVSVEVIPSLYRYDYVDFVAAAFTITGGTAYCGGIVSMQGDYDFEYKIQLQRKSNSSWTTVKTWNHSGNGYDSTEDSYTLTKSGDYRCLVTAYVKGSNGAVVEAVPCASGSEYYSK